MAWTKTSKGKDVLFEETVVVNDSGGAAATYAFTSAIPNDIAAWENKKVTVRLEVTEVSATDGDLDAYIQTSANGLTTGDTTAPAAVAFPNWVNASANINTTLDTSALSVASTLVDLTDVYAPFMRVYVYTDGADIEDACSIKVSLALAAEDDLETSDIGGVGADPS
tara:strand:- start:54 stop:554 length:501 start_codon:yes stop_codon:yes gene_type:complete